MSHANAELRVENAGLCLPADHGDRQGHQRRFTNTPAWSSCRSHRCTVNKHDEYDGAGKLSKGS